MQNNLAPVSFGVDDGPRSADELRAKVFAIEALMLAAPDTHVEIPVRHYFANGMYAREVRIPKGTTVTGKIHKTEHINVISQGDISVLTENGIERLQAPYTLIAKPGTKRVGYAHEDTVWTTFHSSQETDLVKLEAELIASSYEEFLAYENQLLLEGV